MRKGDSYTLVFAAIVCVACSLTLSVTSALLREKQEEQSELDRRLNIMKAFGVPIRDDSGRKLSVREVNRIFDEHIRDVVLDAATGLVIPDLRANDLSHADIASRARLPLYEWTEGGEPVKFAFPVSGKGLWSTIYGYMALDRDLNTILGVTFYRHGETPGLGGEISTDWFQAQFRGKKILDDGMLQPFEVLKGKVADRYPAGNEHAVDGISGATLTGKGINQFLNRDLQLYEKYFAQIRDN
ncbi:MAG: Na(+)-translocating NADH-quinone reductase subunit C [Verrucomicrobia bacterium ADurb.Bin345]|nr:MAG: Na(+)-translocating NADH-quinone reductase subunit C [Verrucomicrobia bacterium ADurb.Bin345]